VACVLKAVKTLSKAYEKTRKFKNYIPVSSDTRAATFSAKPIRVFKPVPTAVPPAKTG